MSERILVVDGDPDLRRGHARILAGAGFDVLEAATGEQGLALARSADADLVLLDATLPDLSGLEVCRRLKSGGAEVRPFVIMTSGRGTSPDEEAERLEAGADGHLTKPIAERALLAHVRAVLRILRAERELRASEERHRHIVEELTEANRRLEEYNRLKAEFVANMSHELRTPLTAIIGFAQLAEIAEGGKPIPQPYGRAFERILRNGRHLLALIDDVLDVAKIEAGRMRLHREHFDLAEVVQSAFSELQSLARQRSLDYRLVVRRELPLAYSDSLRVRQVVINLLSNALKFTHAGTVEATLEPAAEEGWFRFVVRDTGVGIEEGALGIIFERFRQVDGSMSRRVGGAGLGLSIVRQIVDLLGGTIEVASRKGEGSTFTVTLPLVAPESSQVPAEGEPAGVREAADAPAEGAETAEEAEGDVRPLVLAVEDDADFAALLTSTIEAAGFRVRVAPNGPRALEMARRLEPAVITLDIMMPGMDGWRVLQELKNEPRTAQIPVVVCSIVDNRPLGFRLGASAYLLKPFEPERLAATLRSVSSHRHDGLADDGGYVLVVEDEHGVRELLVSALARAGYLARSASSGETALAMTASAVPLAVICDLMMPGGMSGFELIARLRAEPRTADTPIVVLTGKDITQEDRRFIIARISNMIRKGDLLMTDLGGRLREVLEELGVKPLHVENPAG